MSNAYSEFDDEVESSHPDRDGEEPIHYFCRLTFGQFFTLVLLLIITVCSTFYLGARYGNYYLRLDGTAINETAKVPVPPRPAEAPITAPQQEAIQSNDLKRLARQALAREQQQQLEQQVEAYLNAPVDGRVPPAPTTANGVPAAGQPVANPVGAPAPSAVAPSPPVVAERTNDYPPPPPPVETAPTIPPPAGATGVPYAVQVGAYRNYDEANLHLENWKTRGYPAYLTSAELDSGRWYRVRLGTFATREDAQTYRDELGRREAIDGIVVRNE